MSAITLLDGPLGTELLARGVPTPLPGWSAHALETHPEVVSAIHADYARAGALVHTANTFRTKRRTFPEHWSALAQRAVALCREAIELGDGVARRVAGSLAPLEDCYRPELSPLDARAEHAELAGVLADCGVDLILVETFPHVREGWIAVEEAVATGVETWAAFTAGPQAELLSPRELAAAARGALERGATAVLVNCTPVARTLDYVAALAELGAPFGAYANAGAPEDGFGWRAAPSEPQLHAREARRWLDAGATIVGSCCGTSIEHIAALRQLIDERER